MPGWVETSRWIEPEACIKGLIYCPTNSLCCQDGNDLVVRPLFSPLSSLLVAIDERNTQGLREHPADSGLARAMGPMRKMFRCGVMGR